MKFLLLSALLGALFGGLLSLIFDFWSAKSLTVLPAEYHLTFWQYVTGFLVFGLFLGNGLGIVTRFKFRRMKGRMAAWSRLRRIPKRRKLFWSHFSRRFRGNYGLA